MKQFKDTMGRAWIIAINVAAVERGKGTLDLDLMEIVGGDLLERFVRNPTLLIDTVFVVCKPQADEARITDEQFGEALDGETVEAAQIAFLEELADFFPGRRQALLAAMKKMKEVEK